MTDTHTMPENAPPTTVKSRKGRRLFGVLLVLLLLLMGLAAFLLFRLLVPAGVPSSAELSGITWVRSIYGTSDAPDDQFFLVQSAVPGPDGSIWINDSQRRAIYQFTPDGRWVSDVTGPEVAPLGVPGRVTFGPDGLMYVCETANDVVRVIDQNGEDAGSFAIPKPFSVAVNEDRIVVGTRFGFAILDKEGKPLRVIGELGQGDGQFDYVHGVAIAENGNVYVVDSFNNRLSAYDPEGEQLWIVQTGLPTNQADIVDDRLAIDTDVVPDLLGTDALQLPMGLTIDGAGRLVIIDMFECAIAVFDAEDGSFIGKYGDFGNDDGKFLYPTAIAYDAERDWFTVADNMNNRAQIIRIAGSSGGSDATAAVRRALAGPLRACLFPLLLLILVIITWLVVRANSKRRATLAAAEGPATVGEVTEEAID